MRTGDTFYACDERDKTDAAPTTVQPLPGFKPAKSMVYAGLYPVSADEFEQLNEAILKLTLNDASVSVEKESSVALGQGFRYVKRFHHARTRLGAVEFLSHVPVTHTLYIASFARPTPDAASWVFYIWKCFISD